MVIHLVASQGACQSLGKVGAGDGFMKRKSADIRMVSKLAEVSVATVSRAFSHPGKLAPATLKKVMSAAEQLNYRPNAVAQALRSNRTNTILVIVPDIANNFYFRVLDGIEACAKERGFWPLLLNSKDDEEVERNCIGMVRARRADGIIQLGARSVETLLQGESAIDIPFVHAVEFSQRSFAPSVGIDNRKAAQEMTDHILQCGHRRIGVIGGSETSDITQQRLEGYKRALKEAGVEFNPNWIEYGEYSMAAGLNCALSLLARAKELTAVFCLSDEIAIGAMAAARKLGLSIPEDLSITGFDNIEFGQFTSPPLTTITQPSRRMGHKAMELMLKILDNDDDLPEEPIILGADLVIRESLAPCPGEQA